MECSKVKQALADSSNTTLLVGDNVLVHCRAGRSRSVTVVISCLMKKYGYSPEQAMNTKTVLRNEANPNPGFRSQLEMWQRMNFVLLGDDREYRLVLVAALKNRLLVISKYGHNENWTICREAINTAFICYLQKVVNAETNSKSMDRGKSFRCSSCSKDLFLEINEIKKSAADGQTTQKCQYIYVEPIKWILHDIMATAKSLEDILKGDVTCSQCKQSLGSYDWHLNSFQCDCESHKELNYFLDIQIAANKVTKD